jgi:hypothetical protein
VKPSVNELDEIIRAAGGIVSRNIPKLSELKENTENKTVRSSVKRSFLVFFFLSLKYLSIIE